MNETLVTSLNSVGTGTFLTITIAIINGAITFYKITQKVIIAHNNKVVKRAEEEKAQAQFRKDVCELTNKFSNIETHMQEDREQLYGRIEKLENHVQTYDKYTEKLESTLSNLDKQIDLLIGSDREAIKSYITTEYYKWIDKKYIPYYAKEALEARYKKYTQEKGNTFITELMTTMRTLEVR